MTQSIFSPTRRTALGSLGVTLLAGSFPAFSHAQSKAATLSLDTILARNISARGGSAAWHSVQTLSMSGLMDVGHTTPDTRKLVEETRGSPDRPRKRLHPELTAAEAHADTVIRLPYLIEFRRPRQMRVEIEARGAKAIQVYNGSVGWKLRPYLGRHEVEPYSAYEQRLAQSQQELDGPLIDYAAKGTHVELAGVDPVDGREAYKLKLALKNGDQLTLWIDAQTFLDVRLAVPHSFGGKERIVVTTMSDYRKVGNLMLPFVLEDRYAGATTSQRIDIHQVSVNPALPDSHFSKPT
ncbi:outer membrane lipoprotein-sorting protein [Rhodoferax sp.]|uniref:outer membrane lipoprotein-sorting protein n=1 Tax=Rhodoferax sp. TaxID=50421 RepID=UPI00284FF28A|nr:outer membrane lipoprotein-sorting protein [Rhodoferax sp.]MDR3370153.1 outer membrane lipoprotein-sorting protein [Rhodoferax sp.]